MSDTTEHRCEDCKFLYKQDEGYSNYTVTDTTLHCLKNLNPAMPKDEDYRPQGGDPALAFGETCAGFSAGEGLHIDPEREDAPDDDSQSIAPHYTDDEEIIAAFNSYEHKDW